MGSDVMGPTFLALIMLNAMFAIVASCPGRQRTNPTFVDIRRPFCKALPPCSGPHAKSTESVLKRAAAWPR
jgi:hypothetical protein